MGRIRSIKPELITSPVTGQLSDLEFRLLIVLHTLADDEGVCPADPAMLQGQLWGQRPSRRAVTSAQNRLKDRGLVRTDVASDGNTYHQLVSFRWRDELDGLLYQSIEKPTPSRYPLPKSFRSTKTPRTVADESPSARCGIGTGIGTETGTGTGTETGTGTGNGREANGAALSYSPSDAVIDRIIAARGFARDFITEVLATKFRNVISRSNWSDAKFENFAIDERTCVPNDDSPVATALREHRRLEAEERQRASGYGTVYGRFDPMNAKHLPAGTEVEL
jgi:hypothetical protein